MHLNRKYEWEKWFKQKEFVLQRGVHYDCLPHSMVSQIRNYAGKNNLTPISVGLGEDGVITVRVAQRKRK